jgi:hypothetical protein
MAIDSNLLDLLLGPAAASRRTPFGEHPLPGEHPINSAESRFLAFNNISSDRVMSKLLLLDP